MFCTIQRCPVCKPNGEGDWGRASFAAECMPDLVAPALGVSRSDLDAHIMWRLAGLSTNEARAAYGLSPIDSKESFSNQIGSPCHAPPIDEPSPPGFADFAVAVRKRLEPFGVEVRFEIHGHTVRTFAGLRHGGTVVNANRCIPVDLLPFHADRIVFGLMTELTKAVVDMPEPGSRFGGVSSYWKHGTNTNPVVKSGTINVAAFVAMTNQDDAPIILEAKKIPCPVCSHLASATCFMCGRDGESDDCQPLIVNGG